VTHVCVSWVSYTGWLGYGAITEDPPIWLRDWRSVDSSHFRVPKRKQVFIKSPRYSCPVSAKKLTFAHKFRLTPKYQISWKSNQPFSNCYTRTDGWSYFNRGSVEMRTHLKASVCRCFVILNVTQRRKSTPLNVLLDKTCIYFTHLVRDSLPVPLSCCYMF
jgi:hypothetical protein